VQSVVVDTDVVADLVDDGAAYRLDNFEVIAAGGSTVGQGHTVVDPEHSGRAGGVVLSAARVHTELPCS
jgi:hypothetical protein